MSDDYVPYRRIELWKAAVEAGIAGEVCDRIVRSRPVPAALIDTLCAQRPRLTGREEDVLRLAAEGLSEPQTADRLGLSVNTVKDYTKRARHKLGAENITHAVARCYELGYLGREAA